jgi:hypothetical protein
MASVVCDEQSLGLWPVLVTEIFRFPLSAAGCLGFTDQSAVPQERARRTGRDVRTSVLHRSDALKPGPPIAPLSLFGNPE